MTYSVVIPVYNGLDFLSKYLPSVFLLRAEEVILVDDCSTDGSAHYIQSQFPQAKLLRHLNNTRFPIAANDGVALATGDVVILMNQDVQPDKDLLRSLANYFEDPQVFAVTFNENNHSWAKISWKFGFIEFENGSLDNHSHASFWASGGSAAFRRSYWKQLGGFDSIFTPGYFEDFDLGWRAWKRGWKIIWDPQSKVTHPHPESSFKNAFSPKPLIRIKERNYLIAHWKNLDLTKLPFHLYGVFRRIVFHPGFFLSFISALEKLPKILYFRIRNRKNKLLPDGKIFSLLQKRSTP